VIDDDADSRNLCQVILEDAGYDVEAYGDPREAFLRMRAGSAPEVVITDLRMPHMPLMFFVGRTGGLLRRRQRSAEARPRAAS